MKLPPAKMYPGVGRPASMDSTDQAGLSTLPHSRQQISQRGVIRPQKGHIRCDAKSPARGVARDIFLSQASMKT
jgi:hypothetical protein